MKWALSLMLIGSVLAKNLPANHGETRLPIQKQQFELTYYDLRKTLIDEIPNGVIVEFEINESGQVENPVIRKSFEFSINNTIIDKVMMLKFKPALQNGRPVRVRYKLPILFGQSRICESCMLRLILAA